MRSNVLELRRMKTRRTAGSRNPYMRGTGPSRGPAISLVIALDESRAGFEAVLATLAVECQRSRVEIVVACSTSRRFVDGMRRRHPSVRFVMVDGDAAMSALRAAGTQSATGELVILLDASASASSTNRAAALLSTSLARADALGGSAEPSAGTWKGLLSRLSEPSLAAAVAPHAHVGGASAGCQPSSTSHVLGD